MVGHSHSGKTALTEWMLYDEHVLTKPPSSENTFLDHDQQEMARHSTVFSHFTRIPHSVGGGGGADTDADTDAADAAATTTGTTKKKNSAASLCFLLQVTDTPWGDFPTDAVSSTDGADAAVLVISAADGVQAGTVSAFQHCSKTAGGAGIPILAALSKMDRPFVQIESVLQEIQDKLLHMQPVPLQVVVNGQGEEEEESFCGIKSLLVLQQQQDKSSSSSKNEQQQELQITKNADIDNDKQLQQAWTSLEEAVAMTNDDLLVEYLENDGQLEAEQVVTGLKQAVIQGKILPVVYTSAEKNLGVKELMDTMVAVLPNPIEMREEAIRVACEQDALKESSGSSSIEPGVEAGFAARVLHTTVDSFGSLSVLRVISNSRSKTNDLFDSLPHEAVVLRTGEKVRMPSTSTSFGLCGKDRQPLADGTHIIPGDVIAVPKLPETVQTNDILTIPMAVQDEQAEIEAETAHNVLTPLSRPVEDVALMTTATISLKDSSGSKKGKGGRSAAGGGSGDEKLLTALRALSREDLALQVDHDVSGKLLVHCMSGDHLQIVAGRLMDRYGLDVELGRPPVQYRETLAKPVKEVEGRHKKQSGGSGQFGVCYISIDPLEEGAGIEFVSQIKGGVISKPFIASVEKGVREQLQSGGPMGYPVTDVRVTLTDGKMHSVDSKDIAFQSAGKLAVKAALEKGKTRLLQPMEQVTFTIDENLQGEINTIVARGDGFVTATHPPEEGIETNNLQVEAIIPTASIGEIADVLRAASGGEAQFISTFSHYQPVPENLVAGILGSEEETSPHP